MRRLFIRYVNGGHIIRMCSTSSNTQVIRNYSPQSGGMGGGGGGALLFLVACMNPGNCIHSKMYLCDILIRNCIHSKSAIIYSKKKICIYTVDH